MCRMIVSAGLLLFVGATVVFYLKADAGDAMQRSTAPRRQVSVTLLGPADAIGGIAVPEGLARQNSEYLRLDEPSDVTVTLPDGTRKHLPVKYVSVNVQYGAVADVHLLPLLKSLPFKEAVAELHRLLGVLKIEPDERMKEKMRREWPDDAPGFDPVNRPGFYPHNYRTGMQLSEDAALSVKLRSADDGGWFLVLTFEATGPKRRALWDRSATQPSTQPSTQPATRPAADGR